MYAINLEKLIHDRFHTHGKWWVVAAVSTLFLAYVWLVRIGPDVISEAIALLLRTVPILAGGVLLLFAVEELRWTKPPNKVWGWASFGGFVLIALVLLAAVLRGKRLFQLTGSDWRANHPRSLALTLLLFVAIGAIGVQAGHDLALGSKLRGLVLGVFFWAAGVAWLLRYLPFFGKPAQENWIAQSDKTIQDFRAEIRKAKTSAAQKAEPNRPELSRSSAMDLGRE